MKTLEVPATKQFRKMLADAREGMLVLTERAKPVAALVPIANGDAESLSLSTNPKFLRILRRGFKELDRGKSVSLAEMRKRVG